MKLNRLKLRLETMLLLLVKVKKDPTKMACWLLTKQLSTQMKFKWKEGNCKMKKKVFNNRLTK